MPPNPSLYTEFNLRKAIIKNMKLEKTSSDLIISDNLSSTILANQSTSRTLVVVSPDSTKRGVRFVIDWGGIV